MAWYSGVTNALGAVTGGLLGTTKKPSTNLRFTAGTQQDVNRFADAIDDKNMTYQQKQDRVQREAGEQGRYLLDKGLWDDPYAAQNLQRYGKESNAYRDFGRELLGQQRQSIGQLQDAAYGNAPSAAQMMMGQGLQSAQAQQIGAASASRGGSRGLALRNALSAGADLAGQTVGQAGVLRAQEMQQARQDLSSALANYGQLAAQQSQFYEQMGYGAQQAQLQAKRDLETYLANRETQLKGIQSGVGIAAEQAQAQKQAAVLGAGATVAGGLLGSIGGGGGGGGGIGAGVGRSSIPSRGWSQD